MEEKFDNEQPPKIKGNWNKFWISLAIMAVLLAILYFGSN